jgi:hypothetical protein
MPKPQEDETRKEFISRCIEYVSKEKDWDQDQVAAYCYHIWREENSSKVKGYLIGNENE